MQRSAFYILFFLLYIGGNYYVVSNIQKSLTPGSPLKAVTLLVAIAGIAAFFIYMFFHDALPYQVSRFFFFAGTTWLNFFFYLFLFTLISSILLFVNKFIPLLSPSIFQYFTKHNTLLFSIQVALISLILVGGYVNYLCKRRVNIPIQLSKTIPSDSIKILAISDLHLGYAIGSGELRRWVQQINSEHLDMVLIAGDLIDISLQPVIHDSLDQYLREIKAPLGVYACLGNHEYYAGADECSHFFQKANIHLLRDSAALIANSFYVIGRDDRTNPTRKSVQQLVSGLDRSKPLILLDHQPFHMEESEKNGIDLQISGHTHDGQIWPFSLILKLIYEKKHGFITKRNTNIYVSSGLGIWGGKFRIGTQSEYAIFHIKGNK